MHENGLYNKILANCFVTMKNNGYNLDVPQINCLHRDNDDVEKLEVLFGNCAATIIAICWNTLKYNLHGSKHPQRIQTVL